MKEENQERKAGKKKNRRGRKQEANRRQKEEQEQRGGDDAEGDNQEKTRIRSQQGEDDEKGRSGNAHVAGCSVKKDDELQRIASCQQDKIGKALPMVPECPILRDSCHWGRGTQEQGPLETLVNIASPMSPAAHWTPQSTLSWKDLLIPARQVRKRDIEYRHAVGARPLLV